MNNELEKQLAKVVEKSLSIAEKTGDFVIEQAPDLLREFYTWHITFSSLYMLLAVFLGVLIYMLSSVFGEKEPFECIKDEGYSFEKTVNSVKHYGRYFVPGSDMQNGLVAFRVISVIVFLLVFIPNLIRLLKILIAPKIYLIEYFIR